MYGLLKKFLLHKTLSKLSIHSSQVPKTQCLCGVGWLDSWKMDSMDRLDILDSMDISDSMDIFLERMIK